MFGLGMQEMIIVGIVAILLFGKRLPEVARSLGSSYNQFRRGLQDIQSDLDVASSPYHHSTSARGKPSVGHHSSFDEDDDDQPTAPKFEPPTSEPNPDSPESA